MKPLVFTSELNLAAGMSTQKSGRRFSIEAYDGGLLPVSGFDQQVIVDLQGLSIPGNIPILIDHQRSVEATLGQTDSIDNTGTSLVMSGPITATSPLALGVLAQSDAGQQWQASIGCLVDQTQDIAPGQVVAVNGQTFTGPCIVARKSVLRETSVLPIGAATSTSVNLAAAAARLLKGAAAMTFEEWIASLGIDPAALNDVNRAALTKTYDLVMNPAPVEAMADKPEEPVVQATEDEKPMDPKVVAAQHAALLTATMRKAAAAEQARQAQLASICVGHPKILEAAIGKGWSPIETENAVLKEQAKTARPAPGNRQHSGQMQPRVIEAAICMTRKIKGHEKQFTDQELQTAHTQFRGGIGLQQILLQAAVENGLTLRAGERIGMGNLREVLMYALPGRRELNAAFSTVSLPGIFSNIANKELLQGYEEEDQTWKEIAAIKSVSDFKTVTSYRMLDNMQYEALGPGGTITHGTIGEESYTRTASTYAKMFSLTRTDIINDDLGAFDALRTRLGAGAAQKLNRLFWTRFLANTSFFTSGRGNYITGATTTLLQDGVGLELAITAFDALRTPVADGSKIPGQSVSGAPEILLHPPELQFAADRLYQSTTVNTGGAATGANIPNANIHANKYKPVKAKFLSDSSISGYSSTGWYLLRAPRLLPAVVVSFLNGQEQPTVESAEADFDTLGVQFRGYHDFGVDLAEYLCGVKSKGAA